MREEHGTQYERIVVPITDGRRVYNIAVNLEEADASEGKSIVKELEKSISLYTLDEAWKEHLREMDELRNSVQNASYENKDPLLIYKLESYELFKTMIDSMNRKASAILMRAHIQVAPPQEAEAAAAQKVEVKQAAPERPTDMSRYKTRKDDIEEQREAQRAAAAGAGQASQPKAEPVRAEPKIGRNDPCPCGSGKKFKNCHGRDL